MLVNKFVTVKDVIKVYLNMNSYRLDRTAFKAQTVDEATKADAAYSKTLTWQERLKISNYLNSVAYGYSENDPPRLDKTIFKAIARK
jgi:outer membrane protease